MFYVALHSYATFTNFLGYLHQQWVSYLLLVPEGKRWIPSSSFSTVFFIVCCWGPHLISYHIYFLPYLLQPLRKLLGMPETTVSTVQLQIFFCKSLTSPHLHLTMYPQDAAHTEVLQCPWMLLLCFGLLQPLLAAGSARRWISRDLKGWFWWPVAGASSEEQTEVNAPAVFSNAGPSFLS